MFRITNITVGICNLKPLSKLKLPDKIKIKYSMNINNMAGYNHL